MTSEEFDALIVGGGHNGLVASGYLGRAGLRVRLLERQDHVGGAAVSARPFGGVDARLSRYAYLVSLLPAKLLADLGVSVRLARRRCSSYTPDPATSGATGLLVGPRSTFSAIGAAEDEAGFNRFYRDTRLLTEPLWPSLTEPLLTRAQARNLVLDTCSDQRAAARAWSAIIERPISETIVELTRHDVVRGVVATDALIGTFARLGDPTLRQNICLLYHVLGGGTGTWDVPIGGMGTLSEALAAAARGFGADIVTDAEVHRISPDGEVTYSVGDDGEKVVRARHILAAVTPAVLAELLGEAPPDLADGAQVKVNMMVRRLPALRDGSVTQGEAFGGTFHVNETLSQLDTGYQSADRGQIPDPLPCEIYCHSLADPSILSPALRRSGAQTLTAFGLHTPHALYSGRNPDALRSTLVDAVLCSLNSVLAEPIQDVLMEDVDGRPCIEAKTTLDLHESLRMTGGNIFHGALSWPFAEDDDPLDTAARRWGVSTRHSRIILCGSGSRRGGAVSGIGGHNAAMAVLESRGG